MVQIVRLLKINLLIKYMNKNACFSFTTLWLIFVSGTERLLMPMIGRVSNQLNMNVSTCLLLYLNSIVPMPLLMTQTRESVILHGTFQDFSCGVLYHRKGTGSEYWSLTTPRDLLQWNSVFVKCSIAFFSSSYSFRRKS